VVPPSAVPAADALPLVVHVGFAGSRFLFDRRDHPKVDADAFERAVQAELVKHLRALPGTLHLTPRHRLCGVSQVAIGADTAFTRACAELGLDQRVLLPESREAYLAAVGTDGTPDFDGRAREAARELLAGAHIIEERVVSQASDRHARFEDTSAAIARISDVVVSVRRHGATPKPGGTLSLLERAELRGHPVLDIVVAVGPGGAPRFTSAWRQEKTFRPPSFTTDLAALGAGSAPARPDGAPPSADAYAQTLKRVAGDRARSRQTVFTYAAFIIIVTHVLATIFAVIALVVHGGAAIPLLLGGELLLLGAGFYVHQLLHHAQAAREWALARLVAEIGRSAHAARGVTERLGYLFDLPMPPAVRPLLHALDVLRLREARRPPAGPPAGTPAERRSTYVAERLDAPRTQGGQIAYYAWRLEKERRWLAAARWTFRACTLAAIVATLSKLLSKAWWPSWLPHGWHEPSASVFGSLAIVLPVIAVAALSLAASFDLEARVHTYEGMAEFLERQRTLLTRETITEHEFATLALETEGTLLGETATWYSRRAFTSVA
jgi:hypothetical protein